MNSADIPSKTVALAPFNAISIALSVLLEAQGIKTAVIYDNNKKLHSQTIRDIPIRSAAERVVVGGGQIVIVCSFISQKQITKQLVGLDVGKVVSYEEIVDRDDLVEMLAAFEQMKASGALDNINAYHKNVMFGSGDLSIRAALPPREASNGVILPIVSVVVAEACNLRCVECSHLMQYFTAPRTYSIDSVIMNFERLYNATTFIRNLSVSGGEPFLYKELSTVIKRFATYENVGYLSFNTNSTILPDDDFFENVGAIKNLIIRMSDYGEPSRYKHAIAEKCAKYGIRHALLDCATWYGGLRITELNNDFAAAQRVFCSCSSKCTTLAEQTFSKCALATFTEKLGALPENLPGMSSCLDVSAEDFSADTLREFMDSNDALQACAICTGASRTREQVPPGIQAGKPLPYKKYR